MAIQNTLNGNQNNVANTLMNYFNTSGGIRDGLRFADTGRADAGVRRLA